ncbi:hypothetical protein ACOI1C_00460 [Bacillus sp. DJP31]|uniref:hypothetical protein n=1 Tax=Bacillus sp. DJP31 TaxID=3409789 RepID=UPI003BB79976
MKKKRILILLIFIFLCACSFIDRNLSKSEPTTNEAQLLEELDEVVKKAEVYAKISGSTEVQSVLQHQTDSLWRIEFTNGVIIFFDEKTGEMTHKE